MKSQKFLLVVLSLGLLATVGCSRNKQQAVAPAPVQYSAPVAAPAVSAAAPAPVRSSSSYIK